MKKLIYKIGRFFIKDIEKREEWKKNIIYKRIGVNKIDKYCKGKKSIEPWAFIRAKNEIITIDSCLKSILPVITKGVIGYNDCDDGTEEYILEFCKQNPGFIPVKYPYTVYPLSSKEYLNERSDKKKWFSNYCNYILKYIPENEWIIKIDCDHVYDSEKLKKLLFLARNPKDLIVVSRLDVHIINNKVYMTKDSFVEIPDLFIIKNKKLNFKMKYFNPQNLLKANEVLCQENNEVNFKTHNYIYGELTNYHFPTVKKSRTLEEYLDSKELISLEEYRNNIKIKNIIDKKLLNSEKILKIYNNFNFK